MQILMLSPGYPEEMPHFARALAATGARVFGVGDRPEHELSHDLRAALTAYLKVDALGNEAAVIGRVTAEASRHGIRFDRVECLWEPGMYLAAHLRRALRIPGMDLEHTRAFRDKQRMKEVLDSAGIRTPWHSRARTKDEARAAAARCGFPVIVKPIAGAGSTDTHRADSAADLDRVLDRVGHVPEVSVEEFIDGDEFTFDTVSIDGSIAYENVAFYRPRPMDEKKYEWISPTATCLRDLDQPELAAGRRMGRAVLDALGFGTGFSHMEWYRKHDGEVVFGEIGARPPGARLVHVMNFATDADLFRGWAEAVALGRFTQRIERRYNAAIVFKRARGHGRIQRYENLDRLVAELRPWICSVNLLPPGTPRGDWRQTTTADGYLIVRHPELQTCFEIADRIGRELVIHAG